MTRVGDIVGSYGASRATKATTGGGNDASDVARRRRRAFQGTHATDGHHGCWVLVNLFLVSSKSASVYELLLAVGTFVPRGQMRQFVLMQVFVGAKRLAANIADEIPGVTMNEDVIVEPLSVGHDFTAVVTNVFAYR